MSFDNNIVYPENKKYSLSDILAYKLNGIYPPDFSYTSKRSLRKKAESFVVKDNILYYSGPGKSCLNENVTREYLKECILTEADVLAHIKRLSGYNEADGSCTVRWEAVIKEISSRYYWLGIHQAVRNFYQTHVYAAPGTAEVFIHNDCPSTEEDDDVQDNEESPLIQNDYSYFWKRVHVMTILSTKRWPRKVVYVSMDEFSSWVEAIIYDADNLLNLIHFLFKLISRFGLMNRVVVHSKTDNSALLSEAFSDLFKDGGGVPNIEFTTEQDHDKCPEELKLVEQKLVEFISSHPAKWHKHLDLFLLPMRISRPALAEYSPAFLTYGRDIVLPSSLSQRPDTSSQTETHFTAQMFDTCLTNVLEAYTECTRRVRAERMPSNDGPVATGDDSPDDRGDEGDTEFIPKYGKTVATATPRRRVRKVRTQCADYLDGIHHYLTTGVYPSHYTEDMKKNIRAVAPKYLIHEGTMYRITKGQMLLKVVMDERDRMRVLYLCHVNKQEHLPFRKCYERLSKRFFWKGIFCDLCHFIAACTGCDESPTLPVTPKESAISPAPSNTPRAPLPTSNPRRQSMPYSIDRSRRRTLAHIEDTDVDSKYGFLRNYLEYKTFPDGYNITEKQALISTAQTFRLISGDLYYCGAAGQKSSRPRRLLVSQSARHDAMKSCHVVNGKHSSAEETFERVMDNYYWENQTSEVNDFIISCDRCFAARKALCDTINQTTPAENDIGQPPSEEAIETVGHDVTEIPQLNEVTSTDDPDLVAFYTDSKPVAKRGRPRKYPMGPSGFKSSLSNDLRSSKFAEICKQMEYLQHDSIREDIFEAPPIYKTEDIVQKLPPRPAGGRPRKYPRLAKDRVVTEGVGVESMDAKMVVKLVSSSDVADDINDVMLGIIESVPESTGKTRDEEVSEDIAAENVQAGEAGVAECLIGGAYRDVMTGVIVDTQDGDEVGSGVGQEGQELVTLMYMEPQVTGAQQEAVKKPRRRHRSFLHFCATCQKHFSRIDAYQKHMAMHKHRCDLCNKLHKSHKSLLIHKESQHSLQVDKNILCDLCGAAFTSPYLLKRHVSVVHDNGVACDHCDKIFSSKGAYEKHVTNHEPHVATFVCPICNVTQLSQEHLDQHLVNHVVSGNAKEQRVEGVIVGGNSDHSTQEVSGSNHATTDYISLLQPLHAENMQSQGQEPEVEQLTMEITEELTSQLLSGCNVLVDAHGVQYQVIYAEDE